MPELNDNTSVYIAPTMNIPWLNIKEYKDANSNLLSDYMATKEFFDLYLKSDRFKELLDKTNLRFKKMGLNQVKSPLEMGLEYPTLKPAYNKKMFYDKRGISANAYYSPKKNIVTGASDFYNGENEGVLAEEFGHWLDTSLGKQMGLKFYSNAIPLLLNGISRGVYNHKYNYKVFDDPVHMNLFLFNYEDRPTEHYGKLLNLKYVLWKNGIYDPFKKGNTFTREHLNAVKKLPNLPENVKHQLFNWVNDDLLIYMMNTVAQNPQENDYNNLPSYAKQGIRLLPRRK